MRPRQLIMISALHTRIADIYRNAEFEEREMLNEDEMRAVRDTAWRIIAFEAAAENVPSTGPYASREELVRTLRRSYFAKAVGTLLVCSNADGSWAWYCHPCLMRVGDRLESTITYNRETMEFEECPVS